MPNIKSAIKRVKVAERNRLRNRTYKSQLRTFQNHVEDAMKSADQKAIDTSLAAFYKIVDKSIAKGVLHKNTGDRKKSRLAAKLHLLKSGK
ncbi:MAG: 30S ribosomal protein S20 [Gammaproteobacteria bacterium]|nr:30S ribosomal protein S20 [bacterium]MBX9704738.1 30S ribosomal protein S20 [Gammaproteobacteria bacterium]QQR58853.1 MAG: 30S ribosomal protein S20 [Candidatus Melainabacteria bacterium]